MADVVIVGAGPAGMAAAVSAASPGARVLMIDDNPDPGGQIWRGGDPRVQWFLRLKRSGAQVINGARVVSGNPQRQTLLVETKDTAFTAEYRKLVLATGARELFLPFPGWTSPNVLGVGGLQALVKSGLSVAGKRIIVAGTGPFLLAAAAYLRNRGAIIPLIAEQASGRRLAWFTAKLLFRPDKLLQAAALRLRLSGSRYLSSCWVQRIDGRAVTLRCGNRVWQECCDYLTTGYGFQPNVELAASLGCALEHDRVKIDELQRTTVRNIFAAGECTGIGGVNLAIIQGQIAGSEARVHGQRRALRFAQALKETFELRPALRSLVEEDTIICRCEDVRWQTVRHCQSRRGAKLYTRCAMGPCQGRICGPILDFLQFPDRDTPRVPIFPVRLETLITTEEITGR